MIESIDFKDFSLIFRFIWSCFINFNFWGFLRFIVDLAIVSYAVYKIIRIAKETRAWQLLKGIIILLLFTYVCNFLKLTTTASILNHIVGFLGISLVVVFAPELRRMLEQIGRTRFGLSMLISPDQKSDIRIVTKLMIDNVVAAAQNLSSTKTGALMVIERKTKVGEYINTGTRIDSKVSAPLLTNIFVPNTPLHDGAVIIRDNRIVAAACVLPLTDRQNVDPDLGTRHRAAIGITDVSDAVVVVVSEETGQISICEDGKIHRHLSKEEMGEMLGTFLLPAEPKQSARSIFVRKERRK